MWHVIYISVCVVAGALLWRYKESVIDAGRNIARRLKLIKDGNL